MFFEAVTEKDIQDHICCVEFFSFWLCLVKSLRNMSDNKINCILQLHGFQHKSLERNTTKLNLDLH